VKVSARAAAASILVLAAAALFVRLGFWQLARLDERRARNEAVRAATHLPPLVLEPDSLPALMREPAAAVHRRARVRGRWEEGEVVLRGRLESGRPGVHLVTPLRVADSDVRVWVNRGWVAAPDGATPPARPPPGPGEVVVEGLLQRVPQPEGGGEPAVAGDGGVSHRRLDLALLRERSPGPVLPLYLQQIPGGTSAGPPFAIPPPQLDEGPHLGYAVQWFSFAAIAVGGLIVLVLRAPRGS
jgi:surfeit locus 1 family protein